MKFYFFSILLTILVYLPMDNFAGEPSENPVIIDTDCAPDDLRAINYFLSGLETDIIAITSADGVIEPEEGYLKIQALLKDMGHEGIPSSQGIISKNEAPDWRDIAKGVQWGEPLISYSQPTEIKEFLVQTITKEEQPVDIICMGPLTNIANAIIMEPSIKKEINRIIWFDQCQPDNKWTNYGMDCLSGDYLLNAQIPIYRIKAGEEPVDFDQSLLEKIGKINSPYARKIYQTHSSDSLMDKIEDTHLKIWDDLTAMFYFYPELFQINKNPEDTLGNIVQLKDKDMVHDKILETLNNYNKGSRTVLKTVPTDSRYYQEDLAPHIDEIIQNHGIREWEAVVITNEMHHHLGVYSIIGAKMGVRILDYFRAHPGEVEIESYIGTNPPISCMNDGIQVATGSTVGNGNYQLKEPAPFPMILATYKGQTIEVNLESHIYKKIKGIIRQGVDEYGMKTDKYWSFIREISIQKWKELDRKSIFEINKR